jgi:hypothetical protein
MSSPISKLRSLSKNFTDEYGEFKMLQANVAAINSLLEKRGKSEELYNELNKIISSFKEKELKNG